MAESVVEDADVDLSHLGKRFRFPKSFFLAHAIEHASEHRTQVAVTLAHLGVDTPDLDGWAYARKARHGTVV